MQKRAFDLADRGRLREAIDALRAFTSRHPEVIDGWVRLGSVLRRSSLISEAVDTMEEAVNVAPRHPRLLYNLACYHALAGDRTRALQELMKAVAENDICRTLAAQNEDLICIRDDPRFHVLMNSYAEA